MTDESWRKLARFESNDLVRSAYQKRHNRELNASRTRGIVATFIQAREYFSNAGRADISIKPLLLYYGVLALSRGLILICSPGKFAESLKPSHGLDAVDWNGTLSNKPADAIGEVKVRIQKGTMSELLQATDNKAYYCHMTTEVNMSLKYPMIEEGTLLRFEDVVLGLTDLYDEYRLWRDTGFPRELVVKVSVENDYCLIDLPMPAGGRSSESWDSFVPHYPGSQMIHGQSKIKTCFQLPPNVLPLISQSGRMILDIPSTYIVPRIAGKHYLTPISLVYISSYILGMLVRYHSSTWVQLTRLGDGDGILPLIRRLIEIVEDRFPALVLHYFDTPHRFELKSQKPSVEANKVPLSL